MVYNRLPFLTSATPLDLVIDTFIYEVMTELEVVFNIGSSDPSLIGQEVYYNQGQKSLIADVTAIYALMVAGALIILNAS